MAAKRKATRKPKGIYLLRVTLEESHPPIWREVLVPAETTLAALHYILQDAMGWTNSHLHQFVVGEQTFGDLTHDEGELGFEDERKAVIGDLLKRGQSLTYEYDFGDDWSHEVKVVEVAERDDRLVYPLCVGGAGACPPEDVGGVGGYERFLEALKDPGHEEHDQYVEWVGGYFDPRGFDVNGVNARLREEYTFTRTHRRH